MKKILSILAFVILGFGQVHAGYGYGMSSAPHSGFVIIKQRRYVKQYGNRHQPRHGNHHNSYWGYGPNNQGWSSHRHHGHGNSSWGYPGYSSYYGRSGGGHSMFPSQYHGANAQYGYGANAQYGYGANAQYAGYGHGHGHGHHNGQRGWSHSYWGHNHKLGHNGNHHHNSNWGHSHQPRGFSYGSGGGYSMSPSQFHWV